MIALKITNKKEFMAKLLTTDTFDSFFLEEATIDTFNTFHIDGKVHRDFYKNDPDYDTDKTFNSLSLWSEIRPICLNLIKGKRTPLGFKFILHLDEERKIKLVSEADAGIAPGQVTLGLNIRFSNDELLITTGVSIGIFTLDKSIEKAWDSFLPSFLESHGILTQDYD
jgi:hypothetical protein